MKKLLFTMLAALGLSAISHGATFYWGTGKSTALAPYGSDTVYVLLASDWASMDPKSATAVQTAAKSSAGYTAGRGGVYGIAETKFDYGANDLASLDVVFVDIGADGKYFSWAETLTGNDPAAATPTKTSYTDAQMDGFKTAAGGYQAFGGGGGGTIPEPTSGLLLVLGGAMLALRRKRA